MKIIYFLTFFISCSFLSDNLSEESCECEVEVFSASIPGEDLDLFIAPNSEKVVTYSFPYGEENENCIFFFKIVQYKNGWVQLDEMNSHGRYWTKPDKLAINYSGEKLKLYNEEGNLIFSESYFDTLQILRCKKDAVYVMITVNDEVINGWLLKEDQCANPYTTCS